MTCMERAVLDKAADPDNNDIRLSGITGWFIYVDSDDWPTSPLFPEGDGMTEEEVHEAIMEMMDPGRSLDPRGDRSPRDSPH